MQHATQYYAMTDWEPVLEQHSDMSSVLTSILLVSSIQTMSRSTGTVARSQRDHPAQFLWQAS